MTTVTVDVAQTSTRADANPNSEFFTRLRPETEPDLNQGQHNKNQWQFQEADHRPLMGS